jgi:hypothetical protein
MYGSGESVVCSHDGFGFSIKHGSIGELKERGARIVERQSRESIGGIRVNRVGFVFVNR